MFYTKSVTKLGDLTVCCLASLDFFVSWKTENALVYNVSFGPGWFLCHNKEITQIPPIVVFKVLLCWNPVTLITRLTASGLH